MLSILAEYYLLIILIGYPGIGLGFFLVLRHRCRKDGSR